MATLTGNSIASTYTGLLSVSGAVGADTVEAVTDGAGTSTSLSLSQQRATITLGSGAGDDFIVDGTTLVVEGDTNRVGIGQASPDATLDIRGDDLFIGNASTDASSRIMFVEKADDRTQGFSIIYAGSTNPTLSGQAFTATANTFNIIRHDNSVAGATALTINRTDGNVGIGTSPSSGVKLNIGDAVTDNPTLGLTCASSGNPLIKFRDSTNWQIKSKAYTGTYALDINYARGAYNGGLTISDNGAERVRFPSTGGITFNGDTATANALDDYEEGTWTPTLTGGGSYTTQFGKYTKIGRIVHIVGKLHVTGVTVDTTSILLGGLPFDTADASDAAQRSAIRPEGDWTGMGVAFTDGAHFRANGTNLSGVINNAGVSALWKHNSSGMGTVIEFNFSGTYYV